MFRVHLRFTSPLPCVTLSSGDVLVVGPFRRRTHLADLMCTYQFDAALLSYFHDGVVSLTRDGFTHTEEAFLRYSGDKRTSFWVHGATGKQGMSCSVD